MICWVRSAILTALSLGSAIGVTETIDPLAGSYYVESLTNTLEAQAEDYFRRIDTMGAMSTAMMTMGSSLSGIRTQNRVGVGAGFQNGRKALSVGYQRAISDHAAVTIGGAFSGSDKSIGVGGGFGW